MGIISSKTLERIKLVQEAARNAAQDNGNKTRRSYQQAVQTGTIQATAEQVANYEDKPSRARTKGMFFIYPFFLFHMLGFAGSGFFMAYTSSPPPFIFVLFHGLIAIATYIAFYKATFGFDEVKWAAINAVIGIQGIFFEMHALVWRFGVDIRDFPWYRHVIPGIYYVLYMFLLRQLVIDIFGARNNPTRLSVVNTLYLIGVTVFFFRYPLMHLVHKLL